MHGWSSTDEDDHAWLELHWSSTERHRAHVPVLGSSEFVVVSTAAIESFAYLEAGTLEASAGTLEAGTLEAGTLEAGTLEAGTLEAGTLEAGTLEAGTPEAGILEAETYLEDASPVCSIPMLVVPLFGGECLLGWVCWGLVVEGACLRDWVCWGRLLEGACLQGWVSSGWLVSHSPVQHQFNSLSH